MSETITLQKLPRTITFYDPETDIPHVDAIPAKRISVGNSARAVWAHPLDPTKVLKVSFDRECDQNISEHATFKALPENVRPHFAACYRLKRFSHGRSVLVQERIDTSKRPLGPQVTHPVYALAKTAGAKFECELPRQFGYREGFDTPVCHDYGAVGW